METVIARINDQSPINHEIKKVKVSLTEIFYVWFKVDDQEMPSPTPKTVHYPSGPSTLDVTRRTETIWIPN